MKTAFPLFAFVAVASLSHSAPPPSNDKPIAPPVPPPVVSGVARPNPFESYSYAQKPVAGLPPLVTPEQAQAIIDRFKAGYAKLGNPRFLIYVNRELVDEKSGVKLASRTDRTESSRHQTATDFPGNPAAKVTKARGNRPKITPGGNAIPEGGGKNGGETTPGQVRSESDSASHENKYQFRDRPEPSLADRQTVRDVERLFGRPLRIGGASLADQRVATQIMGDHPLKNFAVPTEGEAARKDRVALEKIADVVIEVLISSRSLTVAEVSGDKTYTVPDIQATAIRLKDAKIMGQATASDLVGKDRSAARIARSFDVRDIAEATALSLMEDLMLGVQ